LPLGILTLQGFMRLLLGTVAVAPAVVHVLWPDRAVRHPPWLASTCLRAGKLAAAPVNTLAVPRVATDHFIQAVRTPVAARVVQRPEQIERSPLAPEVDGQLPQSTTGAAGPTVAADRYIEAVTRPVAVRIVQWPEQIERSQLAQHVDGQLPQSTTGAAGPTVATDQAIRAVTAPGAVTIAP